ncbi:hypothetical protein ACNFIA_17480 [Pseudomonas sp. NY15437]|uniref:hypothetical protein n=1 Tax=Pseudomonas sp. NY15437 TaxID=3400360 RepID=UPI003A87D26A
MPSPEHEKLVAMGARWFKKNGFPVIATELFTVGSRERPDVLAFRQTASALIEVKVSWADFRADSAKPERTAGGLGNYRFYLCPEGLILPADLPPRWGLLYAKGRSVVPVVCPKGNYWPGFPRTPIEADLASDYMPFLHQPDADAERSALFSIARRLS